MTVLASVIISLDSIQDVARAVQYGLDHNRKFTIFPMPGGWEMELEITPFENIMELRKLFHEQKTETHNEQ